MLDTTHADEPLVYEYLAERLLQRPNGGGYFADGAELQPHESLSDAINCHASEGWVLDRFEALPTEVWLVFRREKQA
jgi:hypothetical protein